MYVQIPKNGQKPMLSKKKFGFLFTPGRLCKSTEIDILIFLILNVDLRYRDASFTAICCTEVLKAWTFQ